jgi:hypothetical protein
MAAAIGHHAAPHNTLQEILQQLFFGQLPWKGFAPHRNPSPDGVIKRVVQGVRIHPACFSVPALPHAPAK